MKLAFTLNESNNGDRRPRSIFTLFDDHARKYDGYDYLLLATHHLLRARDFLKDYTKEEEKSLLFHACAEIDTGADDIIHAWLLLHGYETRDHLTTFLRYAQDPIRHLALNPRAKLFALHIQLTTSLEELNEMGWRTDWSDEDTEKDVSRAFKDLALAIAYGRQLAFRISGKSPKYLGLPSDQT